MPNLLITRGFQARGFKVEIFDVDDGSLYLKIFASPEEAAGVARIYVSLSDEQVGYAAKRVRDGAQYESVCQTQHPFAKVSDFANYMRMPIDTKSA